MCICCTKLLSKVYIKHCLEAIAMLVMRLTFIKFAHVILVHWCVISIACKMTCEQLASNMQKSMDNT